MKKTTPMKTDLFRFTTLRNPQLISQERKKAGFIRHPEVSKSFFLSQAAKDKDTDTARKRVRDALSSFNPLDSYLEVKQIQPEIYEFSSWLMHHRNSMQTEEVMQQAKGLGSIAPDKLIFIWDNLFYQLLTKKSAYVRQACMQMLIAQHFLSKISKAEDVTLASAIITVPRKPLPPETEERILLYLKRLANAKVIIPRPFTVKKNEEEETVPAPKKDFSDIEWDHDFLFSKHKLNLIDGTKNELLKAGKQFKKEFQQSYQEAEQTHEKKVITLINDFRKKNGPVGVNPPVVAITDGPDLPDFNFSFKFKGPFQPDFSKNILSPETADFIKEQSLEDAKLDNALQLLDFEKDKQRKNSFAQVKASKKIVITQGNIIQIKSNPLYHFSLSFTQEEMIKSLQASLFLSLHTGYLHAFVVSAEYTFTCEGKTFKGGLTDTAENDTKTLLVKLFPQQKIAAKDTSTFVFAGQFMLNNGTALKIECTGLVKNKANSGVAVVMADKVPAVTKPIYGVNKIGILDFRKVEQEICCYVPGEVSHIENILAKEFKERQTRSFTSTENAIEELSENETEKQTDTATTTRNEMNSEINNLLNKDNSTSIGAGINASATFGPVTIDTNASADFATSNSTSVSNTLAKTFAQELTEKALEKIVQKTSVKRTSKILQEYEENNRHGFDNRNGEKHVTGVYRWVDKIYTNRLINYGKRLMYEFMVPEPARFYKEAIIKQIETGDESGMQVLEEPKTLASQGIHSAANIDEKNYRQMAAAYQVQLSVPPVRIKTDTRTYTPLQPLDAKSFSQTYNDIYVEPGYQAKKAEGTFNFEYVYRGTDPNTKFTVNIGKENYKSAVSDFKKERDFFRAEKDFVFYDSKDEMPGPTGNVAVSVTGHNIFAYSVSFLLTFEVLPETFSQWQMDSYAILMQSYQNLMEEFKSAQAAVTEQKAGEEQMYTNPQMNRATEQTEIKRCCIELLTKPFGISMGKDFYKADTSCISGAPEKGIPMIKQTPAFENYASHVKFFEQAFDWTIMAYIFYPYYWADKCKWVDLFQSLDANDPLFQSFLQSGMVRVTVPVRPGFEDAVTYYMETGDIWNGGGLVLDADDDLYLSIAEELHTIEGVVEEEWQTRVPSTLTIVQNESVLLDEGGLPCCEEEENETLKTSAFLIGETVAIKETI